MLSIKKLSVTPSDTTRAKNILENISLTCKKGQTYVVMGPNGSGKSTLGRTIMGDPAFRIKRGGQILLGKKPIHNLSADKRASCGIFLSMQSPLAIPGITVFQLLRTATKDRGGSALELKKQVESLAKELRIPDELLSRSLNDGFSGGERKKIEMLQMAVLDPSIIILDEIDTGVDVDALKVIAKFLKKFVKNTDKTLIVITHQMEILRYLSVDQTIILKDGKIKKKGDLALAKEIKKKGFEHL